MHPAQLLCAALFAWSAPAFAIGTAFTYQGTLEDGGSPANGSYDLQFRALDDTNTQVGPLLSLADVAITNGVFSVQLDFGLTVFTGGDRFLQIGVRPGASVGSFTILAPNTPINPAPYAQVADLALGVAPGAVGTTLPATSACCRNAAPVYISTVLTHVATAGSRARRSRRSTRATNVM